MCVRGVGEKQEGMPAFSSRVNAFQITHSAEELNAFHILLKFLIKIEADRYSPTSKDLLEYMKSFNTEELVLFFFR